MRNDIYAKVYWNEKTKKISDAEIFKGWSQEEQITIRKMIIIKVMGILDTALSYYLKRDEWLREFALNSMEPLASNVCNKDFLKEKAESLLEKYFFEEDASELCRILNKTRNETDGVQNKQVVCELIKEVFSTKSYTQLSAEDMQKVEMFENVYLEPVELLNEYIEEKMESDTYYTILLEQWKTANEMAANISAQRNNMNNFYMSLMSLLIVGVLFSDELLNTNIVAKTVMFLAIGITGIICCVIWRTQIENYGRLNGAKYEIINEIERKLPANVMLYEWMKTEESARKEKKKINFSKSEKDIVRLFAIVITMVSIVMLVGVWWDKIWVLIQNMLNLI